MEKLDKYNAIYEMVKMIPKGKVTTYGALSECMGGIINARMVGFAMSQSHYLDAGIPAHRVVNRIGELTGRMHFSTPETMQNLLESEGLKIENNKIVNFDKVFWHPKEIINNL